MSDAHHLCSSRLVSSANPVTLGATAYRLGCLGTEDSFCFAAATTFFGANTICIDTGQRQIARSVAWHQEGDSGEKFGLLPVANIRRGRLEGTYCLVAHGKVQEIQRVASNEVGLSQCNWQLLAQENMLGWRIDRIATTSTSAAAKHTNQENAVALTSEVLTANIRLPILMRNIQDHPKYTTQFWVLCLAINPNPRLQGVRYKTTHMLEIPAGTGRLNGLLQFLELHQLEVTTLHEHFIPQKSMPASWRKVNFIECEGHQQVPIQQSFCRALRYNRWSLLNGQHGNS